MTFQTKQLNLLYGIIICFCFMPFVSPAMALVAGLSLSLLGLKHPSYGKYTSLALQSSIVLMGFGMNLSSVIHTSKTGFVDTAVSVLFVMTFGYLIAKMLKIDSKVGLLISSGTAICGGSAIAAIVPVIDARNDQISFSLVVVFVLNAIALIIFPMIGHYFNLSQETFGVWAAIAIHDTSSVVGAGATYGAKALEVATTVKLIRALWIIPLSIGIAFFQKNRAKGKIRVPWFIGLFVASILVAYLVPQWQSTFTHFNWLGKQGMGVALFLIGSNISIVEAKKAGLRSFVFGILLWLLVGGASLFALLHQ